jgi:hypothetical protein
MFNILLRKGFGCIDIQNGPFLICSIREEDPFDIYNGCYLLCDIHQPFDGIDEI